MRRIVYIVLGGIVLLGSLAVWQGGASISAAEYEQRLQQAVLLMQQGAWGEAVQSLGPLPETGSAPALGRLWYVRATLAQKLQDAETAQHYFRLVWQGYAPLADYAAWEVVQYAAARDQLPILQDTVAALAKKYPFSRLLLESQLLLAQTLYRLGQPEPARVLLEQALQATPEHPSRAAALAFLGQLYDTSGAYALAFQTLQRLGESYPREPMAATALERSRSLLALLPVEQRPAVEPDRLLASLDRLVEAKLWNEVEARLSTLMQLGLAEPVATDVLLKRVSVAVQRQQLNEAKSLLQGLLQGQVSNAHLAQVYYWFAAIAQRQTKGTVSTQEYERVLAVDPTSPWAAKALLALGKLYEERNDLNKASDMYRQLLQGFPDHEQAPQGIWQAGWGPYRQRRYDAALEVWQNIETALARSTYLPQVLYWLGRIAEHKGQPERAQQLYQRILNDYPAHYYRVQATQRLQEIRGQAPTSTPGLATVPWQPYPLTLAPEANAAQLTREQFHLLRVRELQLLQLAPLATQEIRMLGIVLPTTPPAKHLLATLFVDNRQYLDSFRLLNQLVDSLSPAEIRGLPTEFWTTLYPRPYWPEIQQQSQGAALDPYLVLSLIRQESAFNAAATSHAGARGLMQLMPATAQEVAAKLKLTEVTPERLYDPQLSLMLGTSYFSKMLQRYQGNVVLALAAYNGGPGRASGWRTQWGEVPMDEFIERIPLDETRLYVKFILRNLMLYERLYKGQ